MKSLTRNRPLLVLAGVLSILAGAVFLNLSTPIVAEAASRRYSVDLKGPIPLIVGKSCPVVGTIKVNGTPARNLSFGVHDDVGQRSLAVKTDSSGKFSFDSRPLKSGWAKMKFIFGRQSVTRYVNIFGSPEVLLKSTSKPERYLDYYRLNVCDKSNPLVRCKTVNGAIFCGIEGSTMSYCGRDSDLPDGKIVKATFSAISNNKVSLKKNQCFSDCYVKNYMQSVGSAMPCAEAYCNAICAFAEDNYARGFFWYLLWQRCT